LQVLARIEEFFRRERNQPKLVLGDVFDLIAGTSTGAIIAAFLKWGLSVKEIEDRYVQRGAEMFARERWYRRFKAKYRADAIASYFRKEFADSSGAPALLGSDLLGKFLLVIMRNASTGSPWPLCNNPKALFCDPLLPDCNLNVPLWKLLRASTAAPDYFPPEEIKLGNQSFLFVDGGLTPFNNPALIAVLTATLPQYRIGWTATRNELHVISIGTGAVRARLPQKIAARINLLDQIRYLAPALLGSVAVEQDMLCRLLGDCIHGAEIDLEMGSLNVPALLDSNEQKFTYVRYDHPFEVTDAEARRLLKGETELDNLELIPFLQKSGEEYASRNVRLEHLYPRGSRLG
jgi:hypothetical protein